MKIIWPRCLAWYRFNIESKAKSGDSKSPRKKCENAETGTYKSKEHSEDTFSRKRYPLTTHHQVNEKKYNRIPALLDSKNNVLSTICDTLRDLSPFIQLKNREKHPWRNVTFSKVACCVDTCHVIFKTVVKICFARWKLQSSWNRWHFQPCWNQNHHFLHDYKVMIFSFYNLVKPNKCIPKLI